MPKTSKIYTINSYINFQALIHPVIVSVRRNSCKNSASSFNSCTFKLLIGDRHDDHTEYRQENTNYTCGRLHKHNEAAYEWNSLTAVNTTDLAVFHGQWVISINCISSGIEESAFGSSVKRFVNIYYTVYNKITVKLVYNYVIQLNISLCRRWGDTALGLEGWEWCP